MASFTSPQISIQLSFPLLQWSWLTKTCSQSSLMIYQRIGTFVFFFMTPAAVACSWLKTWRFWWHQEYTKFLEHYGSGMQWMWGLGMMPSPVPKPGSVLYKDCSSVRPGTEHIGHQWENVLTADAYAIFKFLAYTQQRESRESWPIEAWGVLVADSKLRASLIGWSLQEF